MNAEDLKASILQMAIQGKLVPQDPNDEPASVLLERIREEKKQLVKEGKIKNDKNESFIFKRDNHYYENLNGNEICIDDEIPFEIPSTWSIERLKNITINYDSKRIPLSINERLSLSKIYDYYGASGVIDKVEEYIFDTDLLLIGEDGANLLTRSRPIAFIARGKYWVNNHAHVLGVNASITLDYLCNYINSIDLSPYITGTAQPKMNQKKMNGIMIPLPPVNEQNRIVQKIYSLLPLIVDYNDLETALSVHDSTFSKMIRDSIMQCAIRGKLIPPSLSEQPIAIECKNPIVRRDNSYYEVIGKEEVCIDDEIPFEIPQNWKWYRLESITNYGQNISVKSGEIPRESKIIDLEDIEKDTGRLLKHSLVSSSKESTRHKFSSGCVLYSKLRPYLNKVLIPDFNGYCSSEIMVLETNPQVSNEYLQQSLMSPYFIDYAMSKSYGCKMPRLGTNDGKKALIPIPPLPEQQRIISKVKELQSLLDTLE